MTPGSPCVLLVDDEPDNRELLEAMLEGTGVRSIAAADGGEALRRMHARPDDIDVVLLDWMMPDLLGVDVLARMDADDMLRDIPVVMQTAAGGDARVREGLAAGALRFLTKPFDVAALRRVVGVAVRDRERLRKLQGHVPSAPAGPSGTRDIGSLGSAVDAARALGALSDQPGRVARGIHELLRNALEHGNELHVDPRPGALTGAELGDRELAALLADRDLAALLADGAGREQARLHWMTSGERVAFTVQSGGDGFDPEAELARCVELASASRGHGLRRARHDLGALTFADQGREVSGWFAARSAAS